MRIEILEKFAVAIVLTFLGGVIILSTMLSYSSTLTSEISEYCLENLSETGAKNVVCAILLDFRAYDTLGEILIIFVTVSGVVLLNRGKNDFKDC
jgi:multisubunit Na+/H+ antiporter MnhB subunit